MLTKPAAEKFIQKLYRHMFDRDPKPDEFSHWVERATTDADPGTIVEMFFLSKEGRQRFAVKPAYPDGHYYSPVVDPRTVKDYVKAEQAATYKNFAGIPISPESMLRFWTDNQAIIKSTPFQPATGGAHRYHYEGNPYPLGDAVILRAMIASRKPKRIIEVGSGYSTACMLDTADQFGLNKLAITAIDPDTKRLRKLLRPKDEKHITIIESPIQQVALETFTALDDGDILFIDSTHVLKTGADLNHELFHILPILRKGVIVHFHDIPYPFEYTNRAVFELNYSWNETYALRAFLMYNTNFVIEFWNSLLLAHYPEQVKTDYPQFMANPGSGIWLRKIA